MCSEHVDWSLRPPPGQGKVAWPTSLPRGPGPPFLCLYPPLAPTSMRRPGFNSLWTGSFLQNFTLRGRDQTPPSSPHPLIGIVPGTRPALRDSEKDHEGEQKGSPCVQWALGNQRKCHLCFKDITNSRIRYHLRPRTWSRCGTHGLEPGVVRV